MTVRTPSYGSAAWPVRYSATAELIAGIDAGEGGVLLRVRGEVAVEPHQQVADLGAHLRGRRVRDRGASVGSVVAGAADAARNVGSAAPLVQVKAMTGPRRATGRRR